MRQIGLGFGMALIFLAPGMAEPRLLKPGEAAVLGSWSSPQAQDFTLSFKPVTEVEGCLRLSNKRGFELHGRSDLNRPQFVSAGRYALVAVLWRDKFLSGSSMQRGELWVVDAAPDAVTFTGVWPIKSPFQNRFEVSEPALSTAPPDTVSTGFGPLVRVQAVRTVVATDSAPCLQNSQTKPEAH